MTTGILGTLRQKVHLSITRQVINLRIPINAEEKLAVTLLCYFGETPESLIFQFRPTSYHSL